MKLLSRIFGLLGLLIGLGMMIGAGIMARDTLNFLDSAISVPGTVIGRQLSSSSSRHNSSSYHPVIRYTAENRSYTIIGATGSNPPAYADGDQVTISYPPGHPEEGRLNSLLNLWLAPAIVGGLGAVLAAVTLGAGLFLGRGRRRERELLATGQRVEARVTEVALDTSLAVNGVNPFRIVAQWRDPNVNQVRLFRSARIWFDPTEYLPPGGHIGVFIDPANPKRYVVDTTFLPERAA